MTRPAAGADHSRRRPVDAAPDPAPRPPTPADDLARRAAETPSATALAWDGGHMTYRQLDTHAATLAVRFRAGGATPGTAATLCVTPAPDAIAALFALWKAGCIAAPLHERLTPSEVEHARQTVNSSFHIDNQTIHNAPGETLGEGHDLPQPLVGGHDHAELLDEGHDRERPLGTGRADAARATRQPSPAPTRYSAFPDVIAFILTSGSSGPPKALGFTRDTFAASASAVASRLGLGAGDRWGLCLSPGHIGGLSLIVRAVMTGASVRLWPSFDAGAVARAILAGEVTHLAIVPVMLQRILARLDRRPIPASLRCVLVGGAAAPRALLDRAWAAGLPVATTWGMTETASQVATAPPALARQNPGTAGRPLRGVEVRQGPDGTLHVRGPTLASVVLRGPGATPQPLPTDPHGWFATRDLGRVDTDGHVWIEGRADAIIVSGGLNVSPGEVEQVIEALPGVREAVVLGVPDEEWGQVVAAVVEADPAAVTAADVDRHCREHLVRGRCPTRTLVVDELPRTLTGKVMRSRVREHFGPRLQPRNTT